MRRYRVYYKCSSPSIGGAPPLIECCREVRAGSKSEAVQYVRCITNQIVFAQRVVTVLEKKKLTSTK
jgi:hypothetical protein